MRFFILLLTLSLSPLCAHIISTDSLELLEQSIPDLNEHDLVLLDYNKTLATPTDALLQSCGKTCLQARILAHTPTLSNKQVEELISLILLQRSVKLIDIRSPKIVQKLQQKGVKVLILTAVRTGSFGYIPNVARWRLQEVDSLGFDFRPAFPNINQLYFKEFQHISSPPVFLEGLLCSGSVSKGEALKTFFKRTGFRPRRLIFVDNAANHHSSVEECARKMKIPYLGYYYTKGVNERKTIDEQIANFQIHYLITTGEWIDDHTAQRRIEEWRSTPT